MSDPKLVVKLESAPDHVYYNAVVTNDTPYSIHATFSDPRTSAVISSPKDYYLSIIRFTLYGTSIPLFFFPSGKFVVTVENTVSGNFYSAIVPHQIEDALSPDGVFTYSAFLESINTAISQAHTNCVTVELLPIGWLAFAPFMTFDSTYGTFTMNGNPQIYSPGLPTGLKIWFNTYLINYFNAFWGYKLGENRGDYRDFNTYIFDIDRITPAPTNVKMKCEVNTELNWVTMSRILFTTANIPVRSEQTLALSGATVGIPVITDFEPVPPDFPRSNDVYQYIPTGPYRFIDLCGGIPLTELDCKVFWQDKLGNTYPFMIPPDGSFSIKFLFQKKNLNY